MQADELTHEKIKAEIAKIFTEIEQMRVENEKMRVENEKMQSEKSKNEIEAAKLALESKWYPATVGSVIVFALIAIGKFFLGFGE